MNIYEILIPAVWAGGLLSVEAVFRRQGDGGFRPEWFFPAAGFLGLFIYILGLLSALHAIIYVGITIALLILLVTWIVRLRVLARLFAFLKLHPYSSVIVAVLLTWYGLASLSYPVTTDALNVHLGLPKLYARTGHMFFFPGNQFSAAPRTVEMMLTSFYFLGLERAAQFFVMLIAVILVLAVWKRAGDFGSDGSIAAWLMLSVPVFVTVVPAAKNDFLLWGLTFFSFLKYLEFERTGELSHLLWAGVGAGMAAGVKAVGLALLGVFTLIIAYRILLGQQSLRHFFYFAVPFTLLSFPWYLYSWIVTGNPVYPFFDGIFHSPYTSTALETFNRNLAIRTVDRSLLRLLLSPFELLFNPERYDGRLGFAILLFPALLLFVKRIPNAIKVGLGLAVVYYLFWFFGLPYSRFLLPVMPILAVAGAFFFKSAAGEGRWVKSVMILSLIVGVLLPIPSVVRDSGGRVMSVVKGTPKDEFLASYRTLDSYDPHHARWYSPFAYIDCWEFLNRNTPLEDRVGILSSYWTRADAYYLDRPFIFLNPSEQKEYDFLALRSPDDIRRSLGTLGVSYVVLDSVVISQFSHGSPWSQFPGFPQFRDGVAALQSYCENYGKLVFSNGLYRAYKI